MCSAQARFKRYLDLKAMGKSINDALRNSKGYRNPDFMQQVSDPGFMQQVSNPDFMQLETGCPSASWHQCTMRLTPILRCLKTTAARTSCSR